MNKKQNGRDMSHIDPRFMNLPKSYNLNLKSCDSSSLNGQNSSQQGQNGSTLNFFIDKNPLDSSINNLNRNGSTQDELLEVQDIGNLKRKSDTSTTSSQNLPLITIEIMPPEILQKKDGETTSSLFYIDPSPIAVMAGDEDDKFRPLSNRLDDSEKRYIVLGQSKPFRTQEKNMVEKLNTFLAKNEAPEKKNIEEELDVVEQVNEQENEFGFSNRYFISNPTQTCRRCKRPGHFERWCPEEAVERCVFCVGVHSTEDCPQMVCFNCYGMGHRARECVLPRSQNCYRCGKRGHKSAECGMIILKDTYKDKRDAYGVIRCYRCHDLGHIVCKFEIPKTKGRYQDDVFTQCVTKEEDHEKDDDLNYEAFLKAHSRDQIEFLADLDSEEEELELQRAHNRNKTKSKSRSKSKDRRPKKEYIYDSEDEEREQRKNKKKDKKKKKNKGGDHHHNDRKDKGKKGNKGGFRDRDFDDRRGRDKGNRNEKFGRNKNQDKKEKSRSKSSSRKKGGK